MAVLTQIFYIPQFIQVVRGSSAIESGVIIIPLLIVVTFMVFVCQSSFLRNPFVLADFVLFLSSRSNRLKNRPLPHEYSRRVRNLDNRTWTSLDDKSEYLHGEIDRIPRCDRCRTRTDVADFDGRCSGCCSEVGDESRHFDEEVSFFPLLCGEG